MRELTSREMNKRGCVWCTDRRKHKPEIEAKCYIKNINVCIHADGCPYHELDPFETYDDYLKNSKSDGLDELLGAVFKLQRDL